MYDLLNQISSTLINPVMNIAYSLEHLPLLFAFFIGIVGAVAPCQLTSNVSAITIYGNKSLVEKVPWLHVLLFVLGKIVVYSALGIVIWLLGKEAYKILSQTMPLVRKAIGPLLILIGLFMMDIFQWKKTSSIFNFPIKIFKDSYLGSFLIWYFGASGAILKKSRKVGAITQKIAGLLLLVIGILDTLTYWL